MPETRRIIPTRLHSFIIAISLFIFLLSSLSLFRLCGNSFITTSQVRLIIINTASHSNLNKPPIPLEKDKTTATTICGFFNSTISTVTGSDDDDVVVVEGGGGGGGGGGGKILCDPSIALLRVYMYDLPPEFHFGLLNSKNTIGTENLTWPDVSNPNTIPSYPGGLNLQHSIEYWLTLDLIASNNPNVIRPCSVIRVHNSTEADIVFVPFFASLSYNRHAKKKRERVSVNMILQDRLVKFLKGRDEWKRLNGKDHLIIAHHPNSLLSARKHLFPARFVLADFGRYPPAVANLNKDIIAPYKHMVRTIPPNESAPFEKRPTLVYFQGAINRKADGIIRQEMYYLLKNKKDVHFTFGSVKKNGISQVSRGMASSKFCLNIAGDTPSSNRLFDAIASHCVPVIVSDEIELPYEDILDYSELCIFVRASDAIKDGYLLNLLRGITEETWTKMWGRLKEITKHYEYQYPSQPGDAVDMIWQAVHRKLTSVQLNTYRKNRFKRSFTSQ